jgi:hypothetical protein
MNISWDIQSELVKDSLAERDIRNVSNHRRNPELRVDKSREFQKIISTKSPIEILSAAK